MVYIHNAMMKLSCIYMILMTLFIRKFDEDKKLRTVRLTDTAWEQFDLLAKTKGLTRTDLLEQWARCSFPVAKDNAQKIAKDIASRNSGEYRETILLALNELIEEIYN
jgi:hypothetical protein